MRPKDVLIPLVWVVGMSLASAGARPAQVVRPTDVSAIGTANRAGSVDPQVTGSARVDERRVTLRLTDVSIDEALQAVARQAGVQLIYSASVVPVHQRVSVSVSNAPVTRALQDVLRGTGIEIGLVSGDRIVLRRQAPSAPATSVTPDTAFGTVFGLVVDSTNEQPLKGAAVSVKGTQLTDVTSERGYYIFRRVPVGLQTIVVRSLGYQMATRVADVEAHQAVRADFALAMGMSRLQDVVVTATGPQRRLELGNDITIINADSITATQPIANVTDLLRDRVPGLFIQRSSGAPGAPARLKLRGMGTLGQNGQSDDPVVIVDGVRVFYSGTGRSVSNFETPALSALDEIDPNSIATIEVFKGPSAATMYGPDAANGVIVITTKGGRTGPPRWTGSIEQGMSSIPGSFPTNYMRMGHTFASNASVWCPITNFACTADSIVKFQALSDPATTVLGQGQHTAATIGVSGGGSITYAVTASGSKDLGLLKVPDVTARHFLATHGAPLPTWATHPENLSSWSVSSRMSGELGSKTTVSVSTLLTHDLQQSSAMESDLTALMSTRVDPVTGAYTYSGGTNIYSTSPATLPPITQSDYAQQITGNATRFTNVASLNWRPLHWLQASGTVGLDYTGHDDENLEPRGMSLSYDSTGAFATSRLTTLVRTVNLQGVAMVPLLGGWKFQAALGANYQGQTTSSLDSRAYGIPAGSSSLTGAQYTSTSDSRADVASFGWYVEPRADNGRFFLSTGLRFDGANVYGNPQKLVGFPKSSLSWLVSNERWFPFKNLVGTLRLRAAYGEAGTQPALGDAAQVFTHQQAWLDGRFVDIAGIGLYSTLPNPAVKPERSSEFEGGFDASLLDDRLALGFTGYQKIKHNAIAFFPLSPSVYNGGEYANVGTVRNEGIEGTLNAQLVRSDPLSWSVQVNLGRNSNRLVRLAPGMAAEKGNGFVPGYPLNGTWARPILGYADANHDGVIEPSEVQVGDSAVYLGAPYPKYEMSLHMTVSLFRSRLTVDAGFDDQNGLTQYNFFPYIDAAFSRALNDPTAPLGEQAALAALNLPSNSTDYGLIQTVSTLRFNSLSLIYQLPTVVARRIGASTASVALQGTNLGLITNFRGKDPDVNGDWGTNAGLEAGNVLPTPRTWQLRVSIAY